HTFSDGLRKPRHLLKDRPKLITTQLPGCQTLSELNETSRSFLRSRPAHENSILHALGKLKELALRQIQLCRTARNSAIQLYRAEISVIGLIGYLKKPVLNKGEFFSRGRD